MPRKSRKKTMPEERTTKHDSPTEEIIAAFDREKARADELRRNHLEHVRSTRANDRPARNERWPRQK
jgi:hypothetical protein